MQVLGLDIGDKRIGVSKGNPELGVATPYSMIQVETLEQAVTEIIQIIKKEKIEKVIYGLPLKESGEPGTQVEKTEYFIQRLKEACIESIEWIPVDERYTSQIARQAMTEMKVKKKKKKSIVDKLSAVLILQKYFNNL